MQRRFSRRGICAVGLAGALNSLVKPLRPLYAFAKNRAGATISGDQGDGTYLNPIVGGNHPDAGAIRVGQDFYITHSSFSYTPGLVILHSRDLVNWRSVGCALNRYYGEVWAPYLCEFKGHFYIYYPCDGQLHVVHSVAPVGPWSDPVSLHIGGIDPGHIATGEGRRYLHFAGGSMVELSPDGLSVLGQPRNVFSPWPIPVEWRIECPCLEAPKLIFKDGYYYLNVAEGGTSGPSTSHMVVSARSKNVDGPWEYSPFNPIVHTRSKEEKWWSTGHGRLIDDASGGWWITFHGYENGFRTLGRSTLLLPIEWTGNQWFRVPAGMSPSQKLAMPPGTHSLPPLPLSDNFDQPTLALHWQFWKGYDPARFKTGEASLTLKGTGSSLVDSPVMTCSASDHSYTVEVEVEVQQGSEAGLLLFYDEHHSMGLRIGPQGLGLHRAGDLKKTVGAVVLRIVNAEQEIDFYYKLKGEPWVKVQESFDASCYNQNILGGFHDLRPALFATGDGYATFRQFRYLKQDGELQPLSAPSKL